MDLDAAIQSARPGLLPSAQAAERGVEDDPLLVLMEAPAIAVVVAEGSTLASYWARTRAEALAVIERSPLAGVLALSPAEDPGSAGEVIEAFRAANPGGLTIYHGWDYRIEVSAPRALACRADVLLLGGVVLNELLPFLFTCLQMKRSGSLPPPSAATYEALLRQLCPTSAFWKSADALRETGMEPSNFW